jgi:ABC-type phosphate transport system substrate-binding protein
MTKTFWISLALFSGSVAAEVAVVVHPSNAVSLNTEAIAQIYLGRTKSFPDGKPALPLAQAESSQATEQFNQKVLNKSGSQIKAYWSKLVFTGKGTPPKEVGSDAEMLELVSQNPSVIGYVDKAAVTDQVKVLATF